MQGDIRPSSANVWVHPRAANSTGSGNTTDLLLQIVDFSVLTRGKERVYKEKPFGFVKQINLQGSSRAGIYDVHDELRFAALWFPCVQRNSGLYKQQSGNDISYLMPPISKADRSEVTNYRRVSSHFLNMLKSFTRNITRQPGDTRNPALNVNNFHTHCLFYSSTQIINMICDLVAYSQTLKFDDYGEFKRRVRGRYLSIFTERPPAKIPNQKPKAEWMFRLDRDLQAFVKSNIKLSEAKGNTDQLSAEDTIAEHRGTMFTKYGIDEPLHLYCLIRNLWVHWEGIDPVSKQGISYSCIKDPGEFLRYFTLRYPGLVTTAFEMMSLVGIEPVPSNYALVHISAVEMLTSSDYVSDDPINNYGDSDW